MPDSDDINTSEHAKPRYAWVNHPFAGPILVLGLLAVCVIVALSLRSVLRADVGGCAGAPGCSMPNASG